MIFMSEPVLALKTRSRDGFELIGEAPLRFVGASYIVTIFFGYCGIVAGNNTVGSIFHFTSLILSRPMKFVEITLNGLITI